MLQALIVQDEIAQGLSLPRPGHEGDVCADIFLAEDVIVPAHGSCDARTGIRVVPPEGFYFRVVARGLTAKDNVHFPLEIIDPTYRGEIILHPVNSSARDVHYKRGDRIAQLELLPITRYEWKKVALAEIGETKRGKGRLGSTGA